MSNKGSPYQWSCMACDYRPLNGKSQHGDTTTARPLNGKSQHGDTTTAKQLLLVKA